MAEKKDKPADSPAPAPTASGGGKGKFVVITAVLLVGEAALFGGLYFLFGGPKSAQATEAVVAKDPEEEKIVEVLVLNERLANDRTGLTFVYPTEVYVQVKKRDEAWVAEEVERFRNEIRADLVAVWKTAEPHHFQEPRLESLTRRAETLLRERFDQRNASGQPVVVKSVVVSGTGIRVNR